MTIDRFMPVLVVDDHGTMIKVVRSQLRQLGFADVDEANSGAEALTKLCARRYGLIFSDWHMEPMSGLDLLIAIRGDASFKQIPFITVTGRISVGARDCGEKGRRERLHCQTVQCGNAQGQDRGSVRDKSKSPRRAAGDEHVPARQRSFGHDA